MKLIDAITLSQMKNLSRGISKLHGEKFYIVWNDIYGLFNLELLQLGKYAQSIQNSETENKMVSRNTTLPKRNAQTSGFLIQFSPEKTEGAGDVLSPLVTMFSPAFSPPCDHGGLNYFNLLLPLPAMINTDDKALCLKKQVAQLENDVRKLKGTD